MSLTDTQLEILAIEREWANRIDRGQKAQAIRERVGLSEIRYYQQLVHLLEVPEAIAAEPVLLGMLRRRGEARRRVRRPAGVLPV